MTKEQTAGKTKPYLFSQCEMIKARSLVPLQDTPCNKVTYSAAVSVPDGFVVKMSANETGVFDNKFWFMSEIPIPSYLLAIVVGNLETRSLGQRTTVTAEPE